MMKAFFPAWKAYHRAKFAATAESIALQALRRDFWRTTVTSRSSLPSSGSGTDSGTGNWSNTMQPVLHYLSRLMGYSRSNIDINDDICLVNLDEIVSVYAFSKHRKFEDTTLELLARVERKRSRLTGESAAKLKLWRCNGNRELSSYYAKKGDVEKAHQYWYELSKIRERTDS